MPHTLAVIMDPIQQVKVAKDTTLALLLAAQAKGWQLYYLQQADLVLRDGQVYANAALLKVRDDPKGWYQLDKQQMLPITKFTVVLMRKDPPIDLAYIYTTQLLELAVKAGVTVVNNPRSLRDVNEKIFISWFTQCCAPTLVTSCINTLRDFLDEQQDIIVKPLNEMGGKGVYRLTQAEPNVTKTFKTMTHEGRVPIMAQRYIPEIIHGDKRIILISGEAVPYALARIPRKGETRANLAAGGIGKVVELSERDRWICQQVGPILKEKGLLLVGLDVIGDYLTEINVTSPTCLREISKETGLDLAGQVITTIESLLTA